MSSAIIPEIVGQTEILEESPMTEQEQKELIEAETVIKSSFQGKMERDLAIGAGLLKIKRQKLYRGVSGGRLWIDYLKEESAKLTGNAEPISDQLARNLRGFYEFRCEILQDLYNYIILPTNKSQVTPILGYLKNPKEAVEIWKAACSEAGSNKVPTYHQVNKAYYSYRTQISSKQKQQELKSDNNVETVSYTEPTYQTSTNTFYEEPENSTIPVWEQERNTQEVDPYSECKKLHDVLYAAEKSLQDLHGVLYHQINKYGSAYLDQMKQFDAGLYSVSDIDEKIDDLHEQTAYLVDLLQKEVEPNDLVNE
nr:unnamed protein product [uncultured Mediterranean phage uvMED]BAR21452.1 unnamed protein product [uncultured Mediterranean phage uvMED]